jgi:hypothetical protein
LLLGPEAYPVMYLVMEFVAVAGIESVCRILDYPVPITIHFSLAMRTE